MARLHRVLATLTLLVAATALCAAPALARKRDHDKLPDRWERKFHLDTKKNDANRDRDRDGLSNFGEYRSHTNPRKKDTDRDGLKDGAERRFGFKPRDRDSDNDGTKDGKENAGKITALTGSSITIRLAAGGKLNARPRGRLLAATSGGDEHRRRPGGEPGRRPDRGRDDDSGDDLRRAPTSPRPTAATVRPLEPPPRRMTPPTTTPADDADFDTQFEQEFAGGQTCDASSLKRGSLVHEATVDRSGPSPVVTAIKLVRARAAAAASRSRPCARSPCGPARRSRPAPSRRARRRAGRRAASAA